MQMGHVEETIDLKSDEDIPFNSSHTASKACTFDFEASHFVSQVIPSHSWVEQMRFRPLRSIYIVLIKAKINMLLPFGPLAISLHYLTGNHVRSTNFTHCFLIHFIALVEGCGTFIIFSPFSFGMEIDDPAGNLWSSRKWCDIQMSFSRTN